MRDSDARIDLARRIFLACNPPGTPQELFDNGTAADRSLYFRLADLALDVAAGAVREYRTHQATLEAALGEQTDALEFPLAEGTPVLVEAYAYVSGDDVTTVTLNGPKRAYELTVQNQALRSR